MTVIIEIQCCGFVQSSKEPTGGQKSVSGG